MPHAPPLLAIGAAALALATLAGCAPQPPDPPQTHVGTCTHYQSDLRRFENVPNCEMKTRHLLINGLPPVNPATHS